MCRKHIFDFAGGYVEPAAHHHVLLAIEYEKITLVVRARDITCVQPAVLQRLGRLFGLLPILGHHVRRPHTDFARLAYWHFLVVAVEDLDLASRNRKTAGFEQFRTLPVMFGFAQYRHRITFGLAVKLSEHRSDAFDGFDKARRRHRRSAVEQIFERGEIGLRQPGMIEQNVDHGRHAQREIDPFARDRGEYGVRVESAQHVHRAALHEHGHYLCAGDVTDWADRKKTRIIRYFKAGEDCGRKVTQFPMMAERALGLAGGATRVTERGDAVGYREVARRRCAHRLRRREEIAAVVGIIQREGRLQTWGARREFTTACHEGASIDDQDIGFRILD